MSLLPARILPCNSGKRPMAAERESNRSNARPDPWATAVERQAVARDFEWALREARLPLAVGGPLTAEERIYVLADEGASAWLFEDDGMFILAMLAVARMHAQGGFGWLGALPGDRRSLLAMSPPALSAWCAQHGVPSEGEQRLVLWSEWARSEERASLEHHVRQLYEARPSTRESEE